MGKGGLFVVCGRLQVPFFDVVNLNQRSGSFAEGCQAANLEDGLVNALQELEHILEVLLLHHKCHANTAVERPGNLACKKINKKAE